MRSKKFAKRLKEIAKSYNVELKFSAKLNHWGWAKIGLEKITVSSRIKVQFMATATFHEIAHILNKRDGKYPIYHDPKSWSMVGYAPGFLETAHRAELYTEDRGKALMKKHFPKMKFKRTYYRTAANRKWLRNNLKPF